MSTIELEPIKRLGRDLRVAASTLGRDEARFLVSTYYQLQDSRIRSAHQARQLSKSGEPHETLAYFTDQWETLENQARSALKVYAENHPIGARMMEVVGIGPVISAGMLAHIDISKAKTAGAIWKFAGLDPTVTWGKGEKRPWNAELKTLCWKMGESFVKVSGREDAFYGQIYAKRKLQEQTKNASGDFADQAKAALENKNFRDETTTKKKYESGLLPDARLHLRATRYTVKLFLSHLHEVWWREEFKSEPPKPWVIEHGGHAHYIPCPW